MAVTYVVLLAESTVFAFFPMFLGNAVDGLFEKDWYWFTVYLIVCTVGCTMGACRRCVDTRIFGGAWATLSSRVTESMLKRKMEVSKIITRDSLSVRFVDFFEFALPQTITAAISTLVPLVFLLKTVPDVLPYIVGLGIALVAISLWVSHREKPWDRRLFEARDDRNVAIESYDIPKLEETYRQSTRAYIKRSDWAAGCWLAHRFLSIGAEVAVIVSLAKQGATPGELLAAIAFVWTLFDAVGSITGMFNQIRSVEVANEMIAEE
jgi:ABC-type multidrug transport system fused ATPase/permease subunit